MRTTTFSLCAVVLAISTAWLGIDRACCGQTWSDEDPIAKLEARLEAQEAEIANLRERLQRQESLYGPVESCDEPTCAVESPVRRRPVVVEQPWEPSCSAVLESNCGAFAYYDCEDDSSQSDAAPSSVEPFTLHYYADYDQGFVTRPFNPKKHPFELKINGWIQFRHHAFDRDVDTWTDNANVTRPVRNRNAWDIERARLVFSGYALDRRLTYFLQMDGDTDGGETVDFFDYWCGWQCTDNFQTQMGKRKVPASRQWLLGARNTRLVDRPMACDFFRPDRTTGVFGVGTIGETGHYEVMVGNGYRTANLPPSAVDNQLTFAATNYWDPWGDYGGPLVDFAWTCEPLARVGHSFVFAPQSGANGGAPLEEADYLRLTDGTRLTQVDALTPGVTVSDFDVCFYGLDAAMKWRGWSINAEVFLRWIEDIGGDGPLPITSLFQRGFYVEGGRFLVAEKLDVNARYSQISGLFGDAHEWAAGFNWYPLDSARMKISSDVSLIDNSPLDNTPSDIRVGDDGMLFRTQFQAEF